MSRRSRRSRPKRARYGDDEDADTFTASLEKKIRKQKQADSAPAAEQAKTKAAKGMKSTKRRATGGTSPSDSSSSSSSSSSASKNSVFAIPAGAVAAAPEISAPASPSRRPTVPNASKKRKLSPDGVLKKKTVTFSAIPLNSKATSSLVSMMNPLGGGPSGAAVRHPRASPPAEAFPQMRHLAALAPAQPAPTPAASVYSEEEDEEEDSDSEEEDSETSSGSSSDEYSDDSDSDDSDSDDSDSDYSGSDYSDSDSEDDITMSSSSLATSRHQDLDAAARLLLSVSPRIPARPRSVSHLEPLESLAGLASLDGGQLSRAPGSIDKLHVVLSGLSRGRQASYGSLASYHDEHSLYAALAPQSFLLGQAARKSEHAKNRRRDKRKRKGKKKKKKKKKKKNSKKRKRSSSSNSKRRGSVKSKKKKKPAPRKGSAAKSKAVKHKNPSRKKARMRDAEIEAEEAALALGDDIPVNPDCPSSLKSKYGKIYNRFGRVGIFTIEQRRKIMARYRLKRTNRVWKKTVRYDCRKNLADTRLRIKGRFVRRDSEQAKAYFAKLKADLVRGWSWLSKCVYTVSTFALPISAPFFFFAYEYALKLTELSLITHSTLFREKSSPPPYPPKPGQYIEQDKKASPENISKLGASSSSAGQGSKDDSQVPTQKSPIRSAGSKMAASAALAPALTVLGTMTASAPGKTPSKSETVSGTGTALSALKKMPAHDMVASLVPFSAAASQSEDALGVASSGVLPPPASLGAPAVPGPLSLTAMPPPLPVSESGFVRRPRAVSSIF